MDAAPPATPRPALHHDGGCPVCSREIAMYRAQPGAEGVQWVDVTRCSAEQLGAGLTPDAALQRLHLRRADGSLVSGAAAFTTPWQQLPRWAWLGRRLGRPPLLWGLEAGYRAFLLARRAWRSAP